MASAIDETNRRREKQIAYNTERGIDPQPLRKKIVDILDGIYREAEDAESSTKLLGGSGRQQSRGKAPVPGLASKNVKAGGIDVQGLPRSELADLITQMNEQMLAAARELQFEVAARLRDELAELKKELRQLDAAHA
jgi:excinuclease ABC subunit B